MIHDLLNLNLTREGRRYRDIGKCTDSWNELQLKTASFSAASFIVTSCCIFHESLRRNPSDTLMIVAYWSPTLSIGRE